MLNKQMEALAQQAEILATAAPNGSHVESLADELKTELRQGNIEAAVEVAKELSDANAIEVAPTAASEAAAERIEQVLLGGRRKKSLHGGRRYSRNRSTRRKSRKRSTRRKSRKRSTRRKSRKRSYRRTRSSSPRRRRRTSKKVLADDEAVIRRQ